ncbi:hypothetical protein GQ55_7G154600 [Panicum hallii var. hallii]|uniref:Uncharacterized protein n=1 Tax=Panicum hallii var. hallii TaxID=1504633 RepID=A0A2T7CVE6_9POAL|nr:hypothetical protein GQ55_7G154600 [Panicum hallii var. hallii]
MPEEASLEGTPTWIVASVCSVIVLISLVFERALDPPPRQGAGAPADGDLVRGVAEAQKEVASFVVSGYIAAAASVHSDCSCVSW